MQKVAKVDTTQPNVGEKNETTGKLNSVSNAFSGVTWFVGENSMASVPSTTSSISQSPPPAALSEDNKRSKPRKIWTFAHNKSTLEKTKPNTTLTSVAEYRRRFLLALQFYCDTPSLILNSDLPADLVEFVTSQPFPVEALSVILELKRGSNTLTSQQRASELSRKLVESWMSADSCSEALGSLSLGDEVPGLIAETSNLHRLLFAISDCFHIPPEDFQTFLLAQCSLTIAALVFGVKEDNYEGTIRSKVLATLLDRIFIRFHSDAEQFFTQTLNQYESEVKPFPQFVQELADICKEDFVARRLVSRILLGLGNQSAFKFAKTVFLIRVRNDCLASALFFPSEDFYSSTTWNNVLKYNIPLKTQTKSRRFWINWAHFIYSTSTSITQVWESSVQNWEALCRSSAVNFHILLPATYALIALAHEIKLHNGEKSANVLISKVQVFDSVAKCLDSTDEEKKACGMALGQVIGDLHTLSRPAATAESDQGSSSEGSTKLKFVSSNPVFEELTLFYENGYLDDVIRSTNALHVNIKHGRQQLSHKKFQVLDSDDEIGDDDGEPSAGTPLGNFTSVNLGEEDDYPTDERILDYRSKKGRMPSYFSEFIEILVEGAGGTGGNEAEAEALKFFCIMRIPVLINLGVRIDSNMAQTFVKCLLDFESDLSIEVPILFALYEISSHHPTDVFEILTKAAFDKEHYTSGHRMISLRRLSEIVQLVSKSKCLACYAEQLRRHHLELMSIAPEFITKYFEVKKKSRVCASCALEQKGSHDIPEESNNCSNNPDEELTWREIVDKRVKAKTRYFVTPKRKTLLVIQDEYSAKLAPILWASLANRIMSNAGFFMDEQERKVRGAPNDLLLAQMIRVLGRIILGLAGSACPHLRSIAMQVGELSRAFVGHPDATVRQSVFALLAVIVTVSDAAFYVIEAIACGTNIFETLKVLRGRETHYENRALLDHTITFLAQAATQDYRLQFASTSASPGEDTVYSKLRFLPDT